MKLALYVARWGWGSVFVMLWLKAFGYMNSKPELTIVAFIVFVGITAVATGVYSWLIYRYWKYDKEMLKG